MFALARIACLPWGALAFLGLCFIAPCIHAADGGERAPAVVLDIEGAIGPATSDYVTRGVANAEERNSEVVILRMNTPGGLDASMRDIIAAILSSTVPVVSFVAPGGARAASAGTYILYASHIAAMAPATNLGAATPVQIGGAPQPLPGGDDKPSGSPPSHESGSPDKPADEGATQSGDDASQDDQDPMSAKMINDAAAYIRGLAELRGRNAEWAEKAVRQAASLTANEALEMNVIDVITPDVSSLLAEIDGREVTIGGDKRTLHTAEAPIEWIEPDWRTELLSVLTNPNVAFILMMVGIYGLIFELANPGAIVPGVIGAISLLIGLYALNVLPVNYAGLGLIGLGVALMVAEAFMPSFGILGLGGLAAFAVGAVILFDTDVPQFSLSWPVVLGVTATTGAIMLLLLAYIVRSHQRPVTTGKERLVGRSARVESWSKSGGYVRLEGESWHAVGEAPFKRGQQVRVVAVNGLTLVVEPGETAKAGHPS